MAETHAPGHDYHMVEPSPWPAFGMVSTGLLAGGAVMFLHGLTPWVMIVGVLLTLYTMFVWWRDVIHEGTFEGHHRPVVQLGLRYGMALFIASEVAFFLAWFWAYFNASLFPSEASGGRLAAGRHRDLRGLGCSFSQHADPAHLGGPP